MAADRINLVNENQARRALAGLFKHVPNPAGADAYEHLNKIGAANTEEAGVCLAGNCTGQQRFAGARGADHQDALGNSAAEFLEFFRILEEVDELEYLVLSLFHASDVFEGDLILVFAHCPRLALAEIQRAFTGHFDLADKEKIDEKDNQQKRKNRNEEAVKQGVLRFLGDIGRMGSDEVMMLFRDRGFQMEVHLHLLVVFPNKFPFLIGLVVDAGNVAQISGLRVFDFHFLDDSFFFFGIRFVGIS